MTYTILSNKKNISAVIHAVSSNSTIVVSGNSSQSNLAIDSEVLSGAYITQAVWGCDGTGYINIKRGANLVAVYDSTGQHEYAGTGMPITKDAGANVVIEFVNSANSFIVFELQKLGVQSSYINT